MKEDIEKLSYSLNIDEVRFSSAEKLLAEKEKFEKWIAAGMNAGMAYLARDIEKRFDPGLHIEGAKTVISIAVSCNAGKAPGLISRYASGRDYHAVLKEKLKLIELFIQEKNPGLKAKAFVDSSSLAEKTFAARAGIGWIGKNSLLINERVGSWFFLGELVVDIEIEPDPPVGDRCGNCTKCIVVCPTGAIGDDRTIDAGKCISYLTIEERLDLYSKEGIASSSPKDGLLAMTGGASSLRTAGLSAVKQSLPYAFGCDICQEVCPWNRDAVRTREPAFIEQNGLYGLSLERLESLPPERYSELSKGTSLERVSHRKFMNNLGLCKS